MRFGVFLSESLMALNTLDHRLIKEEYNSSFRSNHREDQHAQFNDIVIEHAIRHDPESNWLHSIIVSERCNNIGYIFRMDFSIF